MEFLLSNPPPLESTKGKLTKRLALTSSGYRFRASRARGQSGAGIDLAPNKMATAPPPPPTVFFPFPFSYFSARNEEIIFPFNVFMCLMYLCSNFLIYSALFMLRFNKGRDDKRTVRD